MQDSYRDRILCGNALTELAKLPAESVHCIVTSPPYWGLRDYGIEPQVWDGDPACAHEWDGAGAKRAKPDRCSDSKDANGSAVFTDRLPRGAQAAKSARGSALEYGAFCRLCGAWRGSLGLEPTPELYVEHIVAIFREVRRVLRDDGTLWLNLGDSYASSGGERAYGSSDNGTGRGPGTRRHDVPASGLKPKDLVGIPWRVAFALQADGWYLRSDIIWAKPNPMPESVTDRPTKAHEYLFLLSKSARYFYDAEAIREEGTTTRPELLAFGERPDVDYPGHVNDRRRSKKPDGWDTAAGGHGNIHRDGRQAGEASEIRYGRNRRTVWTIATQPFNEWAETSRLSRVSEDALSDDTRHIVFPNCPEHADLACQLARDVYGEHGVCALNDIAHIDIHLVQELLVGSVPTAPLHVSETTRHSWDWLARECFSIATLRNNGTNRRGRVLETTSPYIAFSERTIRTDDKLTQLVWFALCASMSENSIVPDGSDVHLLERTISRKADNVSSSCCCQFYQIVKEKTSHFATFPEKLVEPCVLAGCPAQTCPECGAPWERVVERTVMVIDRSKRTHELGRTRSSGTMIEPPKATTLGFRPTCACGREDTVPGAMLDPFCGSGTALLVALKLVRRAAGIELKPEYAEMAVRRIKGALPLFAQTDQGVTHGNRS